MQLLYSCITISVSINGRDYGGHVLLILSSFSDLIPVDCEHFWENV